MWPVLTILLLAALAALHLWWRRKLQQTAQTHRDEVEALRRDQLEVLSRERARLEAVFESMAEGFLLLDPAGRIQLSNRAFQERLGIAGELRGKTVLEVLRLPELNDIVDRLAREPRVLGCELKLGRDADRFVEVNAAAVADPSGAPLGAILVFHDLTRIKRLERASSDFVANVSHELRTPLSMIKGYVETLLGGAKDDPETAVKFLQTIARHSDRLALLIEDLLISSELESGRAVMNLRPVPLRPLVDKVIEDYAGRAEKKSVKLLNQAPDLTALADADRLQQVFANLVDNAIKYGRAEGCVTVGVVAGGNGGIEVCVKDDGPGLPPEAVERIFERFYRVDKARSRDQGGTGLGLSIVRDIIQAHGGRVWAESAPGQGAAFFFTLKSA
jgi:two-component system phosphate regulon sensor histidine kinase PhoR